jgi:hypothetical protein
LGAIPLTKVYCGIGSRETPPEVLDVMHSLAFRLAIKGWKVRSGGAPGADDSFTQGARLVDLSSAELYLPWEDFNDWTWDTLSVARKTPQDEAYVIAEQFHPTWYRLGKGGRALHARNVHQVLGFDVTAPELTKFIICWTKNGKLVGGTAQALRLAAAYKIPVFNLGVPGVLDLFSDLV